MTSGETTLLYSTMGELIQKYRNNSDLTISELARRCSINKSVISKIEQGETRRPEMKTMLPIAKVLEIPITEILEYYVDVEQRPDVLLDLIKEVIELNDLRLTTKSALRFLQSAHEESYLLLERLFSFTGTLTDNRFQLPLYDVIIKYAREHGIQTYLAKGLLQMYLIERQDLKHLEESFRVGEEILHYVNFLSTNELITFYYIMSLHAHNIKNYQASIELGKLGHAIDSTDNELKEQVALAICNSYYRMNDITGLEQHLNMYVELGYQFIAERENYYRAVILTKNGHHHEAIPLLKECVENSKNQRLHRVNFLLETLLKINDTYSSQQILDQEEKNFAFDFINPDNFSELGAYYKIKGSFLITQNRFNEGIEAYLMGMNFFGKINDREGIMECSEAIYTFYLEQGKDINLELLGGIKEVYNNVNSSKRMG